MKLFLRLALALSFLISMTVTVFAQPLTIGTVAGTGTADFSGDGGPAALAGLRHPKGIAIDRSGNIYIVDSGNCRIREVTADGVIRTVAGTGTPGADGDGGPAVSAQLNFPYGVAVDGAGNLYIADHGNHSVRIVTADGKISTIAGTGQPGFSGDGGPAISAMLDGPSGIALDGAGNLYIADSDNNRVRKVAPGGVISTIAGTGDPGVSGDGGPAISARFTYPTGIAMDAAGNLYIADSENNQIRKVAPDGMISTFAGVGTQGYGGDDGPAAFAEVNGPEGLVVDTARTVYISENGLYSRIRKVSISNLISTIAGTDTAGFGGDGGPAGSAQFASPTGMAIDAAGNLYVADTANNRIRKIQNILGSPSTLITFKIADRGGTSLTTSGGISNVETGYARIQPDAGSTTPSGVAIFSLRANNVLVSEAGVPASPLLKSARIYAEVSSNLVVNTGMAIANPNAEPAVLNFFFTDAAGTDFGAGALTIPANQQFAGFLNQPPFNGGAGIQGTFTFNSNVPVSVVALRGFTNERSEFLMTTLPVINTAAVVGTGTVLLPHFAAGGGWTTQIILVNPTDQTMTGRVQFRNTSGQDSAVTIDGQTGSSFAYSIAGRSTQKLTTSESVSSAVSGPVFILPTSDGRAPSALVVFSFRPSLITVSEAGVPAVTGTALRVFVESSGTPGRPGNIQTGIAVANTSALPTTVIFDLTQLDGSSTELPAVSITLPPYGQVAKFLSEIFPSLTDRFKGVVRITSSSDVSAVGLRGHYNERNDFLITTMPPTIESSPATSAELVFPHVVNNGGYTTQFILFSGTDGQSATGSLRFVRQDGSPLPLNLN